MSLGDQAPAEFEAQLPDMAAYSPRSWVIVGVRNRGDHE